MRDEDVAKEIDRMVKNREPNKLIFDLIKTATVNAMAKDPAHAVPDYNYTYSKELIDLVVNDCISALWTEECRTSDLASEEYTRGSNKIKDHFNLQ